MRRKMMKEDPGVSKAQAWGCPQHPQEIFQKTQASKLGDAPVHPLLHQQSSVRPSPHYIFINSYVVCYAWSILHLLFSLLSLVLFAVHTKLDPSMPCLGEKHAPLLPRMLIVFTYIFLSVQSLLLACCHIQLLFFMFILFRDLALLHQVCISL